MMGEMAEEIAAAAAERERRRQSNRPQRSQSQVSAGTFSNESMEVGSGAAEGRKGNHNSPSDMHHASSPVVSRRRPRGQDDPPGWNSKWAPNSIEWMEQQVAQKSQEKGYFGNNIRTLYRRPYSVGAPSDDDSFHAPLSSWVPQLRENNTENPIDNTMTTQWQSAVTKNALDTAIPYKSWKPKRKLRQLDDPLHNESYNDFSWAPHLHPQGPQALHPYPPGTSRYINDAKSSASVRIDSQESAAENQDTMEVVSVVEDETHRETKVAQEASILHRADSGKIEATISSYNGIGSVDHKSKNSLDGSSKNNYTRHEHDISQGSTLHSAVSDDDIERGEIDFSSFLVETEDTFQVFDPNWNFSPSKGTLCVLVLMIVLALEGLAVGLYFVLRE